MSFSADDALLHAEMLADRGESGKARQLYQLILERYPERQEVRDAIAAMELRSSKLGALSALLEKSEFASVIGQGEALAAQFPASVILHNLLGVAYANLDEPEAAIPHFTKALTIRPDMAQIHVNLGKALSRMEENERALERFLQAVKLKPDYADAHFSLGTALIAMARHEQAVGSFLQTLKLKPDSVDARINLGSCLRELGRTDEAIACFQRVLKQDPDNADVYIHLAAIHNRQKRYSEVITALDAALKIAPERSDARAQRLFAASMLCDWDTVAHDAASIPGLGVTGKAVQPFMLLALDDDPARNRARAEALAREHYAVAGVAPIARPAVQPSRLRLGYFSADFHKHAVLFQLIRALELHDRDRFEIHAYSYGLPADDMMRARVRQAVDVFRDVRGQSGREIAQLARRDGIDIAIDLMGYTGHGRPEIFAHRAAPVQVTWLGYPGTLGAGFMDYMIADRIIVPVEQRGHYAEKIIFMPHAHMATDNTKVAAETTISRREASLPQTGFVFCCFNNSYKISPADFDSWMRLLHRVDGSVLWLAGMEDHARANLAKEAGRRGIAPARLVFAERVEMAEHLARHRLADLFLDTCHYTGHATAADALWMGLPLLTRPGKGFHTRVAASLLTTIGLPELIAQAAQDYERIALDLAQNPEHLATIKRRLRENCAHMPLFDSERFTRSLEDGYRQAYQRWFEGKAPTDIFANDIANA